MPEWAWERGYCSTEILYEHDPGHFNQLSKPIPSSPNQGKIPPMIRPLTMPCTSQYITLQITVYSYSETSLNQDNRLPKNTTLGLKFMTT